MVPLELLRDISLKGDTTTEDEVVRILERLSDQKHFWKMHYDERISRLKKGDELPPGVIKLVKVYIAIKAQAFRWRQDGRSSREQGRSFPGPT